MKKINFSITFFIATFFLISCDKENYEFGDVTAPSNVQLTVALVGADASNPYGDGSGKVSLTATANDAISYKFSIDGSEVLAAGGSKEVTLTKTGVAKYVVTAIAIGAGGTTSSISQEIEVFVDFKPDPNFYGSWKLAPEAGSLGVGPALGNYSWWSSDANVPTVRACLFDDLYVFNQDGTFQNVVGDTTWLETWQGAANEMCGTPVAPHNGTNPATFSITQDYIVLNGLGAYLGLAKVHNTAEDGAPVGNTITYKYTYDSSANTLEVTIQGFNAGVPEAAWYFKFIKVN